MLAGFLGLLLAAGVGLIRDYFDDTVKGADDLRAISGQPVLGTVRPFNQKGSERGVFISHRQAAAAEDFRQVRTSLRLASVRGLSA